jgi:hypothetical protein
VSLNLGDESVFVLATSLEAAIAPEHLLHETHPDDRRKVPLNQGKMSARSSMKDCG